jgi:hypothetical protein
MVTRAPPYRPSGPVFRGASQVEKVHPLGLVQAERTRDRLEDTLRNARQVAALHPVVIVDADPGQGGDLLAPQSWDLSRSVGGEADLGGSDLRAQRREEVPYLGLCVHGFETKPAAEVTGVPCQYMDKAVLSPGPGTMLPWRSAEIGPPLL